MTSDARQEDSARRTRGRLAVTAMALEPPPATKAAPAPERPAATFNISQAALHAVASKPDADGDGDRR
jgi:hypothetical protein